MMLLVINKQPGFFFTKYLKDLGMDAKFGDNLIYPCVNLHVSAVQDARMYLGEETCDN